MADGAGDIDNHMIGKTCPGLNHDLCRNLDALSQLGTGGNLGGGMYQTRKTGRREELTGRLDDPLPELAIAHSDYESRIRMGLPILKITQYRIAEVFISGLKVGINKKARHPPVRTNRIDGIYQIKHFSGVPTGAKDE